MLSWIDVGAVILLALFTYHGSQRGIVRSVLDIFAVLLAIFSAAQIYKILSTTILPFLKTSENVGYVFTFAVVWIAVYLALDILISAVQKLVKVSFLGIVERLGGGALGFVKGILVTGIIIQLLSISPLSPGALESIKNSMASKLTLSTLRQTYSKTFGLFPKIDFFIRERIIPATPETPKKVK